MIRYDNRYDTLGQPLGTPDQEGARERGKILIVVAGRCGSWFGVTEGGRNGSFLVLCVIADDVMGGVEESEC